MKKLVIVLTLLAAVSFAADLSSLSTTSLSNDLTPPTAANAHWQLTGTNVVGCVKDGDTVYGSNDDADLTWDGATIDLTGYDGAAIFVYYTQVTADASDHCIMELEGGTYSRQFPDAASPTWFTYVVPTTINDLDINFRWVSDATGFATGFKMTSFQVVGVNNGDGTYTNVFTWVADNGLTAESHDVTPMGNLGLACLSYRYSTEGGAWLWGWAIDDVTLDADGTVVVDEDFESAGWDQNQNGLDGLWELATDCFGSYTPPGSGQFFMCDSDGHNSWVYNAETFSPWVSVYDATTVTAEFASQFQTVNGADHAYFGYYSTNGTHEINEGWANLDNWDVTDSGTSVEEATWGQIKTM